MHLQKTNDDYKIIWLRSCNLKVKHRKIHVHIIIFTQTLNHRCGHHNIKEGHVQSDLQIWSSRENFLKKLIPSV